MSVSSSLAVRCILFAAMAVVALPSHAFVYCDTPKKWEEFHKARDIRFKAMIDHRFAEVDQHFSSILAAFERGAITDAEVNLEFEMFEAPRAEREPLHAEWIQAFPRSRAAHLAAAYYWVSRAYRARGTDVADKTSPVQMAAMEQAFKFAWMELEAAQKFAKIPTPESGKRLEILRAVKSRKDEADSIYRKTLADHPQSLQVRIAYARASAPQWGGSFEKLSRIRDEARSLPADDRRFVQSRVDLEIGRAYAFRDELVPAAKAYESSMKACPGYSEAAQSVMRIYTDLKDYPALAAATTWIVDQYPNWAGAYASRAWAYQSQHKYNDAYKDWEKAAQLGNASAFEHMAWLTEWGRGAKQDYRKAIDLYMIAYSKGVTGAKAKADKIRAGTGIQ